jgi:7-cyano-7-deazaguanine synthase
MDSTTLLYQLLSQGHHVQALGIDYGQRHLKELDAAAGICARADVPFKSADLSAVVGFLAGSALTSPDVEVPSGEYDPESMKVTVVPNRNMLMLAVALAWAISSECDTVAYAAHAGDHEVYPDCRPEFVQALAKTAGLCHYEPIKLTAPFLHLTKVHIVRLGTRLGVPYDLTWSCYRGEELHCGSCGTCRERAHAFARAGVPDPTVYQNLPASSPNGVRGPVQAC